MPEPKPTLHNKLAQVMAEAERIPKNGSYQGQGGFKYVLVGDAADAIRTALAKRHISMLPSLVEVVSETEHATRSGGTMSTISIRTTWTLTDGESGETATRQSIGTGADAGDKASPKAQTNAMKYALLMGFLLSTGDDPEQSDSSDRQARGQRPEPPRLPARQDPATIDPPATGGGPVVEELIGRVSRRGTIRKGTSKDYQLEARQGPDGHVIGFRLEVGAEKHIPQCLVTGPIGEALFLATAGHPESLIGTSATVAGILYYVKNDKGSWYRLHVDRFENADYVIPSDVALPEPPEDLHLVGETA